LEIVDMDAKEWFENQETLSGIGILFSDVQTIWDAAQEDICKELNVLNDYNRLRYPNGR